MSESDCNSVDEYTSLMDGHVAESRTDESGLVNERRKRRSKITNDEVRRIICFRLNLNQYNIIIFIYENSIKMKP